MQNIIKNMEYTNSTMSVNQRVCLDGYEYNISFNRGNMNYRC